MVTKEELIAFEEEVARRFEAGEIRAPVHLSDGNEDQLVKIFEVIRPDDWVFSNWRSHHHALLHGVERDWLLAEILAGRSITIMCPERKFFSSAIVGGACPIALGVATGIKRRGGSERVWCFVGDMTYRTGVFREAYEYAQNFELPLTFVVEDNNLSTTTPTREAWGEMELIRRGRDGGIVWVNARLITYRYEKKRWPHQGTGTWVEF